MEMAGRVFLKWRVADLLVGFPDIEFGFGTRVRSLPDALRIATPKKRLPGAGGGFLTRLEFLCPYTCVSSHPVLIVWKCVQGSLGTSCVGCWRISLLVCSRQLQEKEEEMLTLQTLCQGQGQSQEVLVSSIVSCVGCML